MSIAIGSNRRPPRGGRSRIEGLRRVLEDLRREAHGDGTVEGDPLASVLAFRDPADQEVAGLVAALLSYGRVGLLRAHIAIVLGTLGDHPARSLRRRVPKMPGGLVYRFHRSRDLEGLLRGARTVMRAHGSLGDAFASQWRAHGDIRGALTGFADALREGAGEGGPGLRFLLADPALGGACKRWHLYLRWMIRRGPEDPDPGPWSGLVPCSVLLVPLDTHVARVSRRLGLTQRRTSNWKMAEEVTGALRLLSREDPVRYDFSLCHLGISGICPPRLTAAHCTRCPLSRVCPTGMSWKGGRLSRRAGRA